MKKPLALAALAAMILIGAAYPDSDKPDDAHYAERDNRGDDYDRDGSARDDRDDYAGRRDRDAPREYRACRDRNDDNCIQLHERGVRESYARWLRDGDPDYQPVRMAAADHRGHHADRSRRHGQHTHHAARAQPRQHRRLVAQARPHHRGAYASTRTRCVPIARRPAARRPAASTARAAPAPARSAWPRAPQPRRPEDSGVRGM